uniref:Hemicentin-2 n=1 Tax=Aceria tosichella TaxID=561515 RepID=A0A6G1S981_9ACAR
MQINLLNSDHKQQLHSHNHNKHNQHHHHHYHQKHLQMSQRHKYNCFSNLVLRTSPPRTTTAATMPNSSKSTTSTATLSSVPSTSYTSLRSTMFWSYLMLVSLFIAHCVVEAKPLNQYQVKFRRVPPKEFSAALGSSITIECEAGASPPPTIHWLKDGKRIIQNELDENRLDDEGSGQLLQVDDVSRIALSSSRSRLYIDCANLADEATYTCVAENAYSRISSQTKLNLIKPIVQAVSSAGNGNGNNENDLVSEEVAALSELAAAAGALKALDGESKSNNAAPLSAVPQCLSDRSRTTPARIHMWTHNIVEIMKNNVVLFCRSNIKRSAQLQQDLNQIGSTSKQQQQGETAPTSVQANGIRPMVSWTLPNDKLVSDDQKDKYEVLETGDLLIKDLSWADMGSYVCTVSDEQSSDSVSAFVYPASVKSTNSKRSAAGLSGSRLTRFS